MYEGLGYCTSRAEKEGRRELASLSFTPVSWDEKGRKKRPPPSKTEPKYGPSHQPNSHAKDPPRYMHANRKKQDLSHTIKKWKKMHKYLYFACYENKFIFGSFLASELVVLNLPSSLSGGVRPSAQTERERRIIYLVSLAQ